MRYKSILLFGPILLISIGLLAQQKTWDWTPENSDSFRIGPGYHSGVAVYKPHGREAIHIRLDLVAKRPVSIGVVRQEDWDSAIQHPGHLSHLDYACLTEGVTRISFSCNFYASNISRVVVVRDSRQTEHPVATGIAAPFVRMGMNDVFANEVHVTPYVWSCTSNCDLPDPPEFAWVDLRKEKYEITPAFKSYGPFTVERDNNKMRIRVKSQVPMTVAVMPAALADDLYAHRDQAGAILAKSTCKQYGIQASTLDCTFQANEGAMQVVLLPEGDVRKKKKAEITISTVQCVANCSAKAAE